MRTKKTAVKAPRGVTWEYGKAEVVLARLKKAAAKAGVDVSALQVEGCALDRTWGDRCGYMFHGAGEELNKRAAAWFLAMMLMTSREGSYEAQRSLSAEPEPFTRSQCSNGSLTHSRGHTGESTRTSTYEYSSGQPFELTSVATHGYAVAYVYYPCAD